MPGRQESSTCWLLQRTGGHLDTVAATALGQVKSAVRLRKDRRPLVRPARRDTQTDGNREPWVEVRPGVRGHR